MTVGNYIKKELDHNEKAAEIDGIP